MADSVVTHVDRPYGQQPETRAAATRFLERTGNADMLAPLGLVDDEPPPSPECPVCGRRLRRAKLGGFTPCQRQLCSGGPS